MELSSHYLKNELGLDDVDVPEPSSEEIEEIEDLESDTSDEPEDQDDGLGDFSFDDEE